MAMLYTGNAKKQMKRVRKRWNQERNKYQCMNWQLSNGNRNEWMVKNQPAHRNIFTMSTTKLFLENCTSNQENHIIVYTRTLPEMQCKSTVFSMFVCVCSFVNFTTHLHCYRRCHYHYHYYNHSCHHHHRRHRRRHRCYRCSCQNTITMWMRLWMPQGQRFEGSESKEKTTSEDEKGGPKPESNKRNSLQRMCPPTHRSPTEKLHCQPHWPKIPNSQTFRYFSIYCNTSGPSGWIERHLYIHLILVECACMKAVVVVISRVPQIIKWNHQLTSSLFHQTSLTFAPKSYNNRAKN